MAKPSTTGIVEKTVGSSLTHTEFNTLNTAVNAVIADYASVSEGVDADTLEGSTKAEVQTHAPASHGNEAHSSTFITAADLPASTGESGLSIIISNYAIYNEPVRLYMADAAQFKLETSVKVKRVMLKLSKTGTITGTLNVDIFKKGIGGFRSPFAIPDVTGEIFSSNDVDVSVLTDTVQDIVFEFTFPVELSAGVYWVALNGFIVSGESGSYVNYGSSFQGDAGVSFGTWAMWFESAFSGGYQSDYVYMCAALLGEDKGASEDYAPLDENSKVPTANLPILYGETKLWNKTKNDIPLGWHECDGTNGTEDLSLSNPSTDTVYIMYIGGEYTSMTTRPLSVTNNDETNFKYALLDSSCNVLTSVEDGSPFNFFITNLDAANPHFLEVIGLRHTDNYQIAKFAVLLAASESLELTLTQHVDIDYTIDNGD